MLDKKVYLTRLRRSNDTLWNRQSCFIWLIAKKTHYLFDSGYVTYKTDRQTKD